MILRERGVILRYAARVGARRWRRERAASTAPRRTLSRVGSGVDTVWGMQY